MTAIFGAAGEPRVEQSAGPARGQRRGPPGSGRCSDPKREQGWFLLLSPRQHQVQVSPQAQSSQLSEQGPSLPLNLPEDTW